MMNLEILRQRKLREEVIRELMIEGQIPIQDPDELLKNLTIPFQRPENFLPPGFKNYSVEHDMRTLLLNPRQQNQIEVANLRSLPFQRDPKATTSAVFKPVLNLCYGEPVKPLSIIPPRAAGGIKRKLESVTENDEDPDSLSVKDTKKPAKDWSCDICKLKLRSEKQLKEHQNGKKHKSKTRSMAAAKETAALSQPLPAKQILAVAEETLVLDQEPPSNGGVLENFPALAFKNYFVGSDMRTPLMNPHRRDLEAKKSAVVKPVFNLCKEPVCSIHPPAAVSGTKRKLESVTENDEKPTAKKTAVCGQEPPVNAQEVGPTIDMLVEPPAAKAMVVFGQEPSVNALEVGPAVDMLVELPAVIETVVLGQERPVNGQKEWKCDLCKVKVSCENHIKAHLNGKKHKSKAMAASKAAAKATATLSQSQPDKEVGPVVDMIVEIPAAEEVNGFSCTMCNFIGTSKEEMIAHRSGNAHLRLFLAKGGLISTDIMPM